MANNEKDQKQKTNGVYQQGEFKTRMSVNLPLAIIGIALFIVLGVIGVFIGLVIVYFGNKYYVDKKYPAQVKKA